MNLTNKYSLLLICMMLLSSSQFTKAQTIKLPSESPLEVIKQDFALSSIEVSYSRPSAKGRTIFGEVVPYDKLWRTGANAPTTIKFGEDVIINGYTVPAGEYLLLTIPSKMEWEIILNKEPNIKNIASYNSDMDLVRFKVKTRTLANKVETFTIDVNEVIDNSATICIKWEKTAVDFKVTANIDDTIMASISQGMSGENKPYYQAALYYYNTKRDSQQALSWINSAIEQNPNAFWMLTLKAKILLRLKDYAGAIEAAKSATAGAIAAGYTPNTYENNKIIDEAQKHVKK